MGTGDGLTVGVGVLPGVLTFRTGHRWRLKRLYSGADSQSSTNYLRNIGDKEKKSEELKFDFLGLYRPAVILGNSNTPSALGFVMPLFHRAMPSRYHSIHKNDLARAMVAQSEQAFVALAHDKGPAAPAVKTLEYKEMEPFFVAGDSDAP
jgi:hypothetical protein